MYDYLNTVAQHPLIPKQAFFFLPKDSKTPKVSDDFKIGQGKGIRRLIFEGWADKTYTPFQLQKLKELQDYIKKKQIKLDSRWTTSWKVRFMQSVSFDVKKCLQDMERFIAYQNRVKDIKMSEVVSKYLKEGIFYIAGRDCHYRPIMVFDIKKIIDLEISEENVMQTQTYFFEYVMRNLLIPGQVENWVAIIDVGFQGLFSLLGPLKNSITFLSDTFRSRMFVCYLVRCPSSIYFLWGIVKKFLQQETIRKINFFDDLKVEPLLEFCNPSQLQTKYGGTLPDIQSNFWPPRLVGTDYSCKNHPIETLPNMKEYQKYYKQKILYNTKFQQDLLIEEHVEEGKRENANLATLRKLDSRFRALEQFQKQQDLMELDFHGKIQTGLKSPLNFTSLFQIPIQNS